MRLIAIIKVLLLGGLVIAALSTGYSTQTEAQTASDLDQRQLASQDVKISDIQGVVDKLETHMEYNDGRIVDLQNRLSTWQGIVVGIGSIIAILDLLQALGFARGGGVQIVNRQQDGQK
jgi:hypothetical protein